MSYLYTQKITELEATIKQLKKQNHELRSQLSEKKNGKTLGHPDILP